ncbi:hypothetical protein BDV93DRAFT_514941 [Ceratobasidium sp. AG-I]|nr:hypothetical protein BDV93DRAFT_514941 [Ceratobasidium sp. AG-I]
MPDWITVSGVVTNVATIFDLGYRYAPYEVIQGKDAGAVLKEVDDILRSTKDVLENHKDILDPEEYTRLKAQYRSYHWRMTDESQQHRAVKDEIIRQSRILSQLYANKESRQDRAIDLLSTVEAYQTNVLAASRSAAHNKLPSFPDEEDKPKSRHPVSQQQPTTRSLTSWFSAIGMPSTSTSLSSDIESTGESSHSKISGLALPTEPSPKFVVEGSFCFHLDAQRQGFVVAVTHFPEHPVPTVDLGTGMIQQPADSSNIYRRMISFENAGRRIDIIDPRLHSLDEQETHIVQFQYLDETALRAMSNLGRRLMNERNAGVKALSPASKILSEEEASNNVEFRPAAGYQGGTPVNGSLWITVTVQRWCKQKHDSRELTRLVLSKRNTNDLFRLRKRLGHFSTEKVEALEVCAHEYSVPDSNETYYFFHLEGVYLRSVLFQPLTTWCQFKSSQKFRLTETELDWKSKSERCPIENLHKKCFLKLSWFNITDDGAVRKMQNEAADWRNTNFMGIGVKIAISGRGEVFLRPSQGNLAAILMKAQEYIAWVVLAQLCSIVRNASALPACELSLGSSERRESFSPSLEPWQSPLTMMNTVASVQEATSDPPNVCRVNPSFRHSSELWDQNCQTSSRRQIIHRQRTT